MKKYKKSMQWETSNMKKKTTNIKPSSEAEKDNTKLGPHQTLLGIPCANSLESSLIFRFQCDGIFLSILTSDGHRLARLRWQLKLKSCMYLLVLLLEGQIPLFALLITQEKKKQMPLFHKRTADNTCSELIL